MARRRRRAARLAGGTLATLALLFLLHPERNARSHYECLERDQIWHELQPGLVRNASWEAGAPRPDCEYGALLASGAALEPAERLGELEPPHDVREGGEHAPRRCKPWFSSAVIVPYRDRADQLRSFLVYMHNFLRRQHLHYRIYVVEQINARPFNRAKLLNIGALHASRDGFPCIILHDVDLLPLQTSNIYACTKQPRHMSNSINKFRYTLPYLSLFGGAVAILTSQFKQINGMSNEYFGWGAEDDDFYKRITINALTLCRFDPAISRYFMVSHRSQSKGVKNKVLLSQAALRMKTDGLNSLQYNELSTVLHPLFTHIMVDF